jgi:23S rRNA (cytosine1962-C5)-methyltransferase
MSTDTGTVHLRKTRARRVQEGHPWVFSNEIASVDGEPGAGDLVTVLLAGGQFLGRGFYHPHSLIAVRILTRRQSEPADDDLLRTRLQAAVDHRQRLMPGSVVHRLVHGEGDFLPGLVVDRYGDVLVLQAFSAGMERRRETLAAILREKLSPRAIVERGDSPLRKLEGLPMRNGMLHGGEPGPVEVEDEGLRLVVDVLSGQKTGAFLDQRQNRRLVRRHAAGLRVLDLFCHDGWFSLHAAAGEAAEVLGVDIAADCLQRAEANAARNGFSERCSFRRGDGRDLLRTLRSEGRRFDLVVLDPPSFTRTRKQVPVARRAYRDLHRAALGVLEPGGLLATASCSHHIREDTFFEAVHRAAVEAGRTLRWVARGMQSPDHPVLVGVPETGYLKFGLFQVL